jgi:hypothetical protein
MTAKNARPGVYVRRKITEHLRGLMEKQEIFSKGIEAKGCPDYSDSHCLITAVSHAL